MELNVTKHHERLKKKNLDNFIEDHSIHDLDTTPGSRHSYLTGNHRKPRICIYASSFSLFLTVFLQELTSSQTGYWYILNQYKPPLLASYPMREIRKYWKRAQALQLV